MTILEPTEPEVTTETVNREQALEALAAKGQENMGRVIRLYQQTQQDPTASILATKLNFLLDCTLGTTADSDQRLQFELNFEGGVLPQFLKQLEDQLLGQKLLVAGNTIPDDVVRSFQK